ncbi:FAD:protein FMN transferase ApbE, partial [Vibrio cholerae]
VLDKSFMTADGLTTGVMVMGEERGMAVAEANQIPDLMIGKAEDCFEEYASSSFKPFLSK